MKRKLLYKKSKYGFVLLLVIAILAAGCAQASPATPSVEEVSPTDAPETSGEEAPEPTEAVEAPPSSAAPETIKIGLSIPQTGIEATIGQHYEQAARLAVQEVNDQGGLYIEEYDQRIPVELIVYDDQSDPDVSVRNTERLVNEDNVIAMVCGYKTVIGMQQSTAIERSRVPCVTGGWAATEIFNRGYKYIFSTAAAVPSWSGSVMSFFVDMIDAGNLPKPTKVAMAVEGSAHGEDFRAGAQRKIEEFPGYFELVADETFEPEQSDFSGLLAKVASVNPDVFIVDSGFATFVTMHRQVIEQRLELKAISYGARGGESEAREALGEGTNYLLTSGLWSPSLPNEASQEFVAKWSEFSDLDPQLYSALGYEAGRVLLGSIEKAGVLDRDAIRDAIASWDEDSTLVPGGRTFFTETGIIDNPLMVMQNMPPDGAPIIVWPPSDKQADPVIPMP